VFDCGKIRYNWQEMKIMGSQATEVARSLVTKEAA